MEDYINLRIVLAFGSFMALGHILVTKELLTNSKLVVQACAVTR